MRCSAPRPRHPIDTSAAWAVPVRIRQAKVAAMRAHAAALRPCRDLRNSTAEQPGNRGLKRFQYPVVVRGSSPVEIEENDSKVLEVLTPESEHWRGLQLDPNHRLLIRRSLVRAQVGEPIKSKGYVAKRNPFLFAILDSDPGCPISSTSPRSYRQISGCLSNVGFAAVRPRLRRGTTRPAAVLRPTTANDCNTLAAGGGRQANSR